MALGGPHVGFLISGDINEYSDHHLMSQVKTARSEGWSTHLFSILSLKTRSNTADALFDTVTLISAEQINDYGGELIEREIVGALSTMDLVVNYECTAYLRLSGEIKRWGINTLFAARDANGVSLIRLTEAALQYEYALTGYTVDTGRFSSRLKALGIPGAKILSGIGASLAALRARTALCRH